MMANAGVNANSSLMMLYVIKDLFGIIVIVGVNVINHVLLQNNQTMKTVSAGNNSLINQLKNVLKTLMK